MNGIKPHPLVKRHLAIGLSEEEHAMLSELCAWKRVERSDLVATLLRREYDYYQTVTGKKP